MIPVSLPNYDLGFGGSFLTFSVMLFEGNLLPARRKATTEKNKGRER